MNTWILNQNECRINVKLWIAPALETAMPLLACQHSGGGDGGEGWIAQVVAISERSEVIEEMFWRIEDFFS